MGSPVRAVVGLCLFGVIPLSASAQPCLEVQFGTDAALRFAPAARKLGSEFHRFLTSAKAAPPEGDVVRVFKEGRFFVSRDEVAQVGEVPEHQVVILSDQYPPIELTGAQPSGCERLSSPRPGSPLAWFRAFVGSYGFTPLEISPAAKRLPVRHLGGGRFAVEVTAGDAREFVLPELMQQLGAQHCDVSLDFSASGARAVGRGLYLSALLDLPEPAAEGKTQCPRGSLEGSVPYLIWIASSANPKPAVLIDVRPRRVRVR
jgi:hypothetical protein